MNDYYSGSIILFLSEARIIIIHLSKYIHFIFETLIIPLTASTWRRQAPHEIRQSGRPAGTEWTLLPLKQRVDLCRFADRRNRRDPIPQQTPNGDRLRTVVVRNMATQTI